MSDVKLARLYELSPNKFTVRDPTTRNLIKLGTSSDLSLPQLSRNYESRVSLKQSFLTTKESAAKLHGSARFVSVDRGLSMPLPAGPTSMNDLPQDAQSMEQLYLEFTHKFLFPGQTATQMTQTTTREKMLTPEQLFQVSRLMGVVMSHQQATECLLWSCEMSQNIDKYRLDLLVQWLCRHVPYMRSLDYFQRTNQVKHQTIRQSADPQHSLKLEFDKLITNTKKSPSRYKDLQLQLNLVKQERLQEQSDVGLLLSQRCQKNIWDRKSKKVRENELFLDSLALNSSNMIAATRTIKLCAVNWESDSKNYQIQSKLTDQMRRRISDIKKYGI